MLSDQDLIEVQKTSDAISETVTIMAHQSGTGDIFEADLINVARQVSGVSMNKIELIEEAGSSKYIDKPTLTLTRSGGPKVNYLAIPQGSELGPFLDAIAWLGKGKTLPVPEAAEFLQNQIKPAEILILIAPTCPHCPQVVRAALMLSMIQPLIRLWIVDAIQFPDLAQKYKVKSTPTLIINDGMTIVGQIGFDRLLETLTTAMEDSSLTSILDSMIKAGRAEDAAELICGKKQPKALLPIYMSKEFSARMGALVTMEEALEINPRVLDDIVEDLIPLLFQEEVALRGDTAELLGKIGNPASMPALYRAAEDPNPDVREAAQEAIEALKSRIM